MKKAISLFLAYILASVLASGPVLAQTSQKFFSFDLPHSPTRPRSYFLPPLASFLLPGFDQWWEDQTPAAAAYTGSALAGLGIVINSRPNPRVNTDLDSRDDTMRARMLGSQIVMAAGSFSAYHSFRSAAKSRQSRGEFAFLTVEETTDDLLLAPFQFSELKRPSTWIPLAGLLGLVAVSSSQGKGSPFTHNGYSDRDFAFGGAFSYLAGTNEEALFRGYLMPVMMESWQNEFWSNTATATLFSLAHLSDSNQVPWPQFVLGWYLGYLAQQNQWTLKQSIFVHAWWDVIAFASLYLESSRDPNYKGAVYLPLGTVSF